MANGKWHGRTGARTLVRILKPNVVALRENLDSHREHREHREHRVDCTESDFDLK